MLRLTKALGLATAGLALALFGTLKELKVANTDGLRGIPPADVENLKNAVEALEEMNASFRSRPA